MTGARRTNRVAAATLVAFLASAALAVAQDEGRATADARFDDLVQRKWAALLEAELASAKQPNLIAWRANVPAGARRAAYERIVKSLSSDAGLLEVFDRDYVQSLIDEKAESRMPVSTNAAATNPVTAGLTERSGGTALAAFGADLSSIVSADKSAVSLSLNALALVSAKDPTVYSSIAAYQDHEFARRFIGTVTFGAKVPEKALTGLSGVPDAETLFDAVAWDVKVRVLGDKDVRSSRWSDLSVRQGGMQVQLAGLLPTIALDPGPAASAETAEQLAKGEGPLILPLLLALTGATAKDVVDRAAKSPQLSLKVSGTHLTKETGKNKYSFAALFDSGAGATDITANVQYSVTDDVSMGQDRLFQVKASRVN